MKKRIITLLSVIALILSLALCLSSCAFVEGLFDRFSPDSSDDGDAGDAGDDGDADGGSTDNGDSGNGAVGDGSGNEDNGTGGGTDDGETPAEDDDISFLPGGADDCEIADAMTSSQRALLSTVIVRPTFNVYSYSARTEIINGSGVIVSLDRESGDAIIVTNYHVVYYKESVDPDKISANIKIFLYGMEAEKYAINAEYIGGSMTEDIAVLRVSGSEVIKNSCAVAARLGNSNLVSVTDEVLVVGNPEGDGISATAGIVSVNHETITMTAADGRTLIDIKVMRVDAAVNQGNSGGGLYDAEGRLIGIVNAKKTGSDIDNIGWALPISRVSNLVDSILDNCDGETVKKTKKAVVGITLYAEAMGVRIDETTGDVVRYELVTVNELSAGCLISDEIMVGDVVTYTIVDGVRLDADRVHMVVDHLLTARVDSTLVIGILRDGTTLEITLTLPESCFVEIN